MGEGSQQVVGRGQRQPLSAGQLLGVGSAIQSDDRLDQVKGALHRLDQGSLWSCHRASSGCLSRRRLALRRRLRRKTGQLCELVAAI